MSTQSKGTMSKESIEVLIVEDNPQDATLVEAILAREERIRFTTHRVTSLKKAIEFLQKKQPQAVLLDLSLPEDGKGVENFITLKRYVNGIPVIILSNGGEEESAEETVRLGAQDYLVKSDMDSSMVPKIILHAIERKKAESILRYQIDFEKIIALISARFLSLSSDQLDQAIQESLARVADFIDADQACLCLFSNQSDCIENVFEWYREDNPNAKDKKIVFSLKKFPWLFNKLKSMESVAVTGLKSLPLDEAKAEREYFRSQGIETFVRVPLCFKGKFVSYLAIDNIHK